MGEVQHAWPAAHVNCAGILKTVLWDNQEFFESCAEILHEVS